MERNSETLNVKGKLNVWAIASLVLSILVWVALAYLSSKGYHYHRASFRAFLWLFAAASSVTTLISGHIAIWQIRRGRGDPIGKKLAIIGLVISGAFILFIAFAILVM